MRGNKSNIRLKSDAPPGALHEGPILIRGLTYSEDVTHAHHTESEYELLQIHGAMLAYRIHACDYFEIRYDPAVSCTRFLRQDSDRPILFGNKRAQ